MKIQQREKNPVYGITATFVHMYSYIASSINHRIILCVSFLHRSVTNNQLKMAYGYVYYADKECLICLMKNLIIMIIITIDYDHLLMNAVINIDSLETWCPPYFRILVYSQLLLVAFLGMGRGEMYLRNYIATVWCCSVCILTVHIILA